MRHKATTVCARCATTFPCPPSLNRIYCSNACYWNDRLARLPSRFWSKVDKTDGCWLWTGAISKRHGYGKFGVGLRAERASRVAWMLASGESIPDGTFVCHTCDVRRCVRNDDYGLYVVSGVAYECRGHLFLAPVAGNAMDMAEKGRSTQGERNAQSKLSAPSVIAIRARYVNGDATVTALAAEYGVSRRHVRDLVHRRRWGHL